MAREFTLANVQACAAGVCELLKRNGTSHQGLVIGYDTRHGSREFAERVALTCATYGIKAYLADRVTSTPTISYAVLSQRTGGAVVITASHNPPDWNGFKFKPEYAGSASPEIVTELEKYIFEAQMSELPELISIDSAKTDGLLEEFNPLPPYLDQISRFVNLDAIRNSGLRVAIDSMHGAGTDSLVALTGGFQSHVVGLRTDPNPDFPGMSQPEPIGPNLISTSEFVIANKMDVAIANDGDADRLGVIDEHGHFITTLQAFTLLCLHLLKNRGDRGAIVKSLTQSGMIDKLGAIYKIPVHTTGVGFKYLGPLMMKENALAAGEESGGYAFRGNIPERDGLLSGLLFLELLVLTGRRPSELIESLYETTGPHHYDRWDIDLTEGKRIRPLESIVKNAPGELSGFQIKQIDSTDGIRFLMKDGFWGLIRPSGTEPLLRLYAEADSHTAVQTILRELHELAIEDA